MRQASTSTSSSRCRSTASAGYWQPWPANSHRGRPRAREKAESASVYVEGAGDGTVCGALRGLARRRRSRVDPGAKGRAMPLEIKGKQIEALRDALTQAFPTYPDLAQLMLFELEQPIQPIVAQ